MQKIIRLSSVALVTLIKFACIVQSQGEQCCARGRGNFRNRGDEYPLNEPVYTSNGIVFCSKGQRCHETTTCQLNSAYGALFAESPPEYLMKNSEQCQIDNIPADNANARRKKRQSNSCSVGDGDMCCETEIYPTQYNGTMQNVLGEEVDVLCLPAWNGNCYKYQFVAEGRCVPGSMCSNNKPCIQEYTVHTLLAYKPGAPFPYVSFEPIKIPAYCSCKNTGG